VHPYGTCFENIDILSGKHFVSNVPKYASATPYCVVVQQEQNNYLFANILKYIVKLCY
jgi:hypothetical protein